MNVILVLELLFFVWFGLGLECRSVVSKGFDVICWSLEYCEGYGDIISFRY